MKLGSRRPGPFRSLPTFRTTPSLLASSPTERREEFHDDKACDCSRDRGVESVVGSGGTTGSTRCAQTLMGYTIELRKGILPKVEAEEILRQGIEAIYRLYLRRGDRADELLALEKLPRNRATGEE